MARRPIPFTFHHVSPDAADLISTSFGIRTDFDANKNELSGTCARSKINLIRSKWTDVMSKYPQCCFSMAPPNSTGDGLLSFNENIGKEIHVFFGSLLSTSKFLIHDTLLKDRTRWTMTFRNEETLVIECQADNTSSSSIRLTLPVKCVHKHILVIDSDTYSSVILSMDTITTDIRAIDTIKDVRLYGNDPLVQSLGQCSDILIHISSKSDADKFLDYLRRKHHRRIFYTMISIENNQCKSWDKMEFNWYSTYDTQYAMSMLHSLGYLFDDKYSTSQTLQSDMVQLADNDERRFYQLAVNAFVGLQKHHCLDLSTIFDQKLFDQIKIENVHQSSSVGVVCLTPTRLCIMPKTKTKGHRAMRHELFQGENNFCLVELKPDPTEKYLTNDPNALVYFRTVFENGIEFGSNRFHLFGSSSSQLKEHSFWFIRASTLDEIDQKRAQLGRLDRIDNLGTYAARLGLWFSTSIPTNIQLRYCETMKEFNKRVQQGEICVTSIADIKSIDYFVVDIKSNDYCFTDGNGFISKGLAKIVAEKLGLCSKTSKQDIFPSAYQIRMAGCKGLLIVDPQSNLDQFYIKIRPSMNKFECDHWILDICETSRPTPTRLNNQIILLLSDLGVPDDTFLRLQKQWFDTNPSRAPYNDALVKNKIPLPANECRYMYGCAFETSLKSGTCFIRYEILDEKGKSLPNPRCECVRGPVIVTKNPCPYAGDMLELTAVDVPELHCLSDIIVFSTEGDRPDFNKIGGSDLDGDGYFVYWGTEFHLQRSIPPLAYTADNKITHPTRITPKDMIDYYLSTLGATSYGEIYNLHAVIVDRNDEKHPQSTCQNSAIELARMFASAIDSGKTGYVIDRERILAIREKYGQSYPDFLMKYGRSYYSSQSIIGKLYRNAVAYKKMDMAQLDNAFGHLNIGDNSLQVSAAAPLNSLPVNIPIPLSNSDDKKKPNSRNKSTKKSMQ